MMSDSLLTTLKKLRLSGLAESLEIRLHEAATSGLGHREFLELLLQDELLVRNSRLLNRRTAAATRGPSAACMNHSARPMPWSSTRRK